MEEHDLPVARDERHFEDYPVGSVALYGPIVVDETEVIEFAKRFDPQDFHTDPVKAAKSPFGGVIASGWHTGSMMMRVLVDRYLSRRAGMGSPGPFRGRKRSLYDGGVRTSCIVRWPGHVPAGR